jgi:hypothetical protein
LTVSSTACARARARTLGFPIHFDWAWKTLFNKDWEDQLFRPFGGSDEFRKVKFSVWIGYDF